MVFLLKLKQTPQEDVGSSSFTFSKMLRTYELSLGPGGKKMAAHVRSRVLSDWPTYFSIFLGWMGGCRVDGGGGDEQGDVGKVGDGVWWCWLMMVVGSGGGGSEKKKKKKSSFGTSFFLIFSFSSFFFSYNQPTRDWWDATLLPRNPKITLRHSANNFFFFSLFNPKTAVAFSMSRVFRD